MRNLLTLKNADGTPKTGQTVQLYNWQSASPYYSTLVGSMTEIAGKGQYYIDRSTGLTGTILIGGVRDDALTKIKIVGDEVFGTGDAQTSGDLGQFTLGGTAGQVFKADGAGGGSWQAEAGGAGLGYDPYEEKRSNLRDTNLPFDVPIWIWNKEGDNINRAQTFAVTSASNPGDGQVEIISNDLIGLAPDLFSRATWYWQQESSDWMLNARKVLTFDTALGKVKLNNLDYQGNSNITVPAPGTIFRLHSDMGSDWIQYSYDVQAVASLIPNGVLPGTQYTGYPQVVQDDENNPTGDKVIMFFMGYNTDASTSFGYATADNPLGSFTRQGTFLSNTNLPAGYEFFTLGQNIIWSGSRWLCYIPARKVATPTDVRMFLWTAPKLRGAWTRYNSGSGDGELFANTELYEASWIGQHSVVWHNGRFIMAYTAKDGTGVYKLAISTSIDGYTWTKSASNPLTTSPLNSGWLASTTLAWARGNHFFVMDGRLYLIGGGYTTSNNYGALGVFEFNDTLTEVNEYHLNPVVRSRPWDPTAGWGHISQPWIYRYKGVWYLYFVAEKGSNTYAIYLMYRDMNP